MCSEAAGKGLFPRSNPGNWVWKQETQELKVILCHTVGLREPGLHETWSQKTTVFKL